LAEEEVVINMKRLLFLVLISWLSVYGMNSDSDEEGVSTYSDSSQPSSSEVSPRCKLAEIPVYTKAVKDIKFTGCSVTEVPDDIARRMPRVETLSLADNRIQRVSPAIFSLASLVHLDLSWNRLKALPILPDSIKVLLLAHNQLESLPSRLPSSLKTLDVSFNALMFLTGLGCSGSLKELNASNNKLVRLPMCLPPSMVEINLSENPGMQEVPHTWEQYESLLVLGISHEENE
jgi:Leucine-rich repeat (LRR) protein